MKKLYIPILLAFIVGAALVEQGCDILSNLFLDQALKQTIVTSGSSSTISKSETFCLSDYDAFDDNVDNIESINYVSAAYFTETYSPGLQGSNIMVTLYAGDGSTIFQVNVPFVSADQFVNNPFSIVLNDAQIALFNQYLADYDNNDCFSAELTVQNVSDNDGAPFSLTGRVEFIVELEIKP